MVIGAVVGVAATFTNAALYLLEDLWKKTRIPWICCPGFEILFWNIRSSNQLFFEVVAAVFVGIIGYFVPETLGSGYHAIIDIASDHLSAPEVLLISFAKFVAWSVFMSRYISVNKLSTHFILSVELLEVL